VPRTLIVLSPRLGPVLPASALPALRAADRVYADDTVPPEVAQAAGAEPAPVRVAQAAGTEPAPGTAADRPVEREVLLTLDTAHPLREHADTVIETPEPAGTQLLEAVAVMDRLRSPGGCPWDAEQTHVSLLQYLVEECYELYQAVEDVDRPALREELGDVLLQVLFHARVAAEGGVAPYGPDSAAFDVDAVAADLVRKLVERHPHVFGDGERIHSASDQELRWDELKRAEKRRESSMDGVALGQPAAALAAKLVSRARKAGLPADLAAGGDELFDLVARSKVAGEDPEQRLRAAARAFDARVRAAEAAARADGLDQHALTPDQWRHYWPGD
jgi:XTP/dITP diphosphohydrolase